MTQIMTSDDSELILEKHSISQMANKINKDKSIRHEYNILPNILNPTKRAKSKYNHYSPTIQGCMNICSGRERFGNFRFILYKGISSTIIMGKLTSKLKQKNGIYNYMGNPSREVHGLNEGERRFLPTQNLVRVKLFHVNGTSIIPLIVDTI